jgi:acyl carrier protein
MNNDEITRKLTQVFQQVLEDDEISITREMTARDVPKWDSLRNIQLITEVEQAFEVKFDLREVVKMKKVGDLIDLIVVKRGGPA